MELIDKWLEDKTFDFRIISNVYLNRYRVDCYTTETAGIMTKNRISESFFLRVEEDEVIDATIYPKPKFVNPFKE